MSLRGSTVSPLLPVCTGPVTEVLDFSFWPQTLPAPPFPIPPQFSLALKPLTKLTLEHIMEAFVIFSYRCPVTPGQRIKEILFYFYFLPLEE